MGGPEVKATSTHGAHEGPVGAEAYENSVEPFPLDFPDSGHHKILYVARQNPFRGFDGIT